MNSNSILPPVTRSWRDIPQPVKPRAMSRGGRWRLAVAAGRAAAALAVVAGLSWGAWKLAGSLGANPRAMPDAARAVPMRPAELRSVMESAPGATGRSSDPGVLDAVWLMNTLALPRNASLMELDLTGLRERLLADRQVVSAQLTRVFPDRLVVETVERRPVARVMAEWEGQRRTIFVSRDGVVFEGRGYEAAAVASLPWLDGVALARTGGVFQPIEGMDSVSELLTRAQLEAEHLFRSWQVISLARLEADHEIEVRARGPQEVTIVFGAQLPLLPQLAKLDYLWSRLAASPVPVRVDLSLGREVAVRAAETPAAATAPGSPLLSSASLLQPRTKS